MSFAELLRAELASVPVKRPCCRKSMIAGFLPAAIKTDQTLVWQLQSVPAADTLCDLVRLQYGVEARRSRVGRCGRHYETVSVSSPSLLKQFRRLEEGAGQTKEPIFSCDGCRSAFLRGMFLSAGTVNDPRRSVHLEFLYADELSARYADSSLSCLGYPPRQMKRSRGTGFYYKDRGTVEELVALMGSHQMIFRMMDGRIEREIRNNENRATNCDTRNISRNVAATGRQTAAIEKLIAGGRLESLPTELRITAKLRMENPEASLETLAKLHNPPVTKSGLNHRLRKLLEEADLISGS